MAGKPGRAGGLSRRTETRTQRQGTRRSADLIRWLAPVGCVVVALAMRLWAHHFQPYVTVDGTEYIRIAEGFRRGQAIPSIFPPGYPLLVALSRFLIDDRLVSAAGVSLVCGALLPLPIWWLARKATGDAWAALPAMAVALHPELSRISAVALSESAYFLFLYLGLAFASRPFPTGLLLGAAMTVRPEGLLSASALWIHDATRTIRRRLSPRSLAALTLGFALLSVPCWLYFRATLGEWTVTPKVVALRASTTDWRANEPRLTGGARGPRYGLIERLRGEGFQALRTYPRQAYGYVRLLLGLWPAPLLLLSLWGLRLTPGRECLGLLPILILPLLGGLGLQPRLLLGMIPALAILAARPLATASVPVWRRAFVAAWLAGGAWCATANAREFQLPFDSFQEDQKDAGRWLAGVSNPDDVVMDRKPYVAFYADRPYRVIPDEPYETLVKAAIGSGVRYLVLDEGLVRVFRPQLTPLLFDPAFREHETRLEVVYLAGRLKGYNVAIFRVLRPGETKSGTPPFFDVRWLKRGAG